MTALSFWVRHPRQALCDSGVWKCHQHPRMLWLASDRRWAWRHRLRARRVARYTGWRPGELAGHIAAERRLLCERLATDMELLRARHWKTTEVRGMAPSLTLHTHGMDTPCGLAATGCSYYPATETITTLFPPVDVAIGRLEHLAGPDDIFPVPSRARTYHGEGTGKIGLTTERTVWR